MRKKIKDEDKKRKMSITIDEELFGVFEKYTTENGIFNKTKYIEKLINDDLISKNIIKNKII